MPIDRPLRLAAMLLALLAVSFAAQAQERSSGPAIVLDLTGPIGPAASDYVARGIVKAVERRSAVVVLRLDTPGGLDTSMREIVRSILASPVPVAAFVAPGGARAASAGTYILYASHIAAMAPGTNLGAATPVQLGAPEDSKPATDDSHHQTPGMTEKAVNDAAAYIRSLAELRGRNVAWAEEAVRQAASLSAEQALERHVVDLIADDVPGLLRAIDGRTVKTSAGDVILATAGATIVPQTADWRTKMLAVITNPNVAALLMLIGVYALIFEFYTPGLVGPGVVGAICVLLALYAFHVLPVDYSGVALLVLGACLMVAEAFVGAFGVLGIGGLVAFVLGAVLLMEEDVPGFAIAWELIGPAALVLGAIFIALSTFVLRARRRPVVAGPEQMRGSLGSVIEWKTAEGRVRVHGEAWRARSPHRLRAGQRVRVIDIDGLTVEVEPEDRR